MKKLTIIVAAIVFVATSCKKDNATVAIKSPDEQTVSTFATTAISLQKNLTFDASNSGQFVDKSTADKDIHGHVDAFGFWSGIDFRQYGYLRSVYNSSGLTSEMAYFNNVAPATEQKKGGAELAYEDIILQKPFNDQSGAYNNYSIEGKRVKMTGIYDMPQYVPKDGEVTNYSTQTVNTGGWIMQTNAHFVPPYYNTKDNKPQSGNYAPLVHVEAKYYGMRVAWYTYKNWNAATNGYDNVSAGHYVDLLSPTDYPNGPAGNSFQVTLDVTFSASNQGEIYCKVDIGPYGTRNFSNSNLAVKHYTQYLKNIYNFRDPSGSNFPLWMSVNCSTGCYSATYNPTNGACGINKINIQGYY